MSISSGKKKVTQDDLRRIMSEQKKKLLETVKKIDSPLAKYSPKGELICILCDSVVRGESVWNVHINSKQHKQNIALAKRKKELESVQNVHPATIKRKLEPTIEAPPKKVKSILKNSTNSALPSDFFENSSTPLPTVNFKLPQKVPPVVESVPSEAELVTEGIPEGDAAKADPNAMVVDVSLPEGFFDDPLLDAKARNVEYKDPIEEEWERFQREMKMQTTVSAQIIADDQEAATAERQIDEIDEQMRNWSRVIDLEKKKDEVVQATVGKSGNGDEDSDSSVDDDNVEFDEYLDWRAKKSFK